MIILRILCGIFISYIILMILLFMYYKYAYGQIQKTMDKMAICVHKIEWIKEYMVDQHKVEYELGSDNAVVCTRFYNRLIDIINKYKDDYLGGKYFKDKNHHKKLLDLVLFKEIFISKKYRKIFDEINICINALIDLIALEKRYRLKEKDIMNYLSIKNSLLKILVKIVV